MKTRLIHAVRGGKTARYRGAIRAIMGGSNVAVSDSMAKQQPRKNKMGAVDGRSMNHQSLEHLRLRAVERIEAGERTVDVARALGFDPAVVSRWVSRARREGVEVLESKPITGRPSKLDNKQVELVRQALLTIRPPLWGFTSELWTRAMVAEVI